MPLNGPIVFAVAAADNFGWAHYFSGRCCQCPQMGPLYLQWQLRMSFYGCITLAIFQRFILRFMCYQKHIICIITLFLRTILPSLSRQYIPETFGGVTNQKHCMFRLEVKPSKCHNIQIKSGFYSFLWQNKSSIGAKQKLYITCTL
jgi:hypothetical protein